MIPLATAGHTCGNHVASLPDIRSYYSYWEDNRSSFFPLPVIPVIINTSSKIGNVRIMQNEGAFDLCILIE